MTIRGYASTAIFALVLGACDGRDPISSLPDAPSRTALGCGDNPAPGPPLGFRVWGQGFDAWEGRTITSAATENDEGAEPRPPRRPIFISTTIRDGAFSLSCPGSLRENGIYPSWALYVDVDSDGRCTPADSGYQQQLYAWSLSIDEEVPRDGPRTIADAPKYTLWGPIGSNTESFCSGYFYE
jgi:hypothetical protein